VTDLKTLKDILRYNDYKNDPYSFDGKAQNPMYAICSRGDLAPSKKDSHGPAFIGTSGSAGGCYDTKVTSYLHGFFNQSAEAINGPTRGNGGKAFEPFAWAEQHGLYANHPHQGLPDVFDFDFIQIKPKH